MKDTQKRFLGAVLAASSVAGIVAPSVTAMAAVSEEIKATPEELRGVINENLPKLKEDPKFSTFHKIKFAADRLRDYNNLADEAAKVMAEIAPYSEKVHTKEIIAIVDAMDKFGQEKNMASYDKILNTDLVALAKTDKDSADYLTQRLDSWGTDVVFKADENYSKATNAIIKVTELRKDGKLDEAKDQVDVAKKAISEIKLAVNKPYLEALLQIEIDAIEDAIAKQDLHVTSVVAKNGREVEVKFNKAISKDSAENRGEYTITAANSDARDEIKVEESELQDDNKTVLLTLEQGKTLNNKANAKYLVKIQKVVTENDEDMQDYSEIISLFDNVKPEVSNVETLDSDTVRVNFSEPISLPAHKNNDTNAAKDAIVSVLKVKLNGSNVSLTRNAISKIDDDNMYFEISKDGAQLEDNKTYAVEIDGLTDYASNALTKFNGEISFKKDNVDPEIEKVEALSQNAFKVTFNEKVKKDTINVEIKKGDKSYKKADLDIKDEANDPNDVDKKTFIVQLKDENEIIDGNAMVTINEYEDLAKNIGDSKTFEIKFEKSHPVLESNTPEYRTIAGIKYAVFTFDRDVIVGDTVKVNAKHVDNDGVTTKFDVALFDVKTKALDLDEKEIALKLDKDATNDDKVLEDGKYTFDFEVGNVKDTYKQNIEKVSDLTFTKSANGQKSEVRGFKTNNVDRDKVIVEFTQDLTKEALDASKYTVDNVQVFEKAELKGDKQTVELTLKDNAIKITGTKMFAITGIDGVKDFNDNKVVYNKETTDITFTENEKPSIDKAEKISLNTIKLTMSEKVKVSADKSSDKKMPLEVRVNGDKEEFELQGQGTNVLTINLKTPLKSVDDKVVIEVLENDDTTYIMDYNENKADKCTIEAAKNLDSLLADAIKAVEGYENNKVSLEDAQKAVNKLKDNSADKINLQARIDEVTANNKAEAVKTAVAKIDGIVKGADASSISKDDLVLVNGADIVEANLPAYQEAIKVAEDNALDTVKKIQDMIKAVDTKIENQKAVDAVAAKITEAKQSGDTIKLPEVPEGYTIVEKESKDLTVYENHKILKTGDAKVVYTVKHNASELIADTAVVIVAVTL